MRRPRNIAIKLALFLLLISGGAIVNVAVAWAFALPKSPSTSEERRGGIYSWHVDKSEWMVSHSVRLGREEFYSSVVKRPRRVSASTSIISSSRMMLASSSTFSPYDIPRWSRFRTEPSPEELVAYRDEWREYAYGWPSLSLLYRQENDVEARNSAGHLLNTPRTPLLEHVIELRQATGSQVHRRLPAGPIWPGFEINTIFYAGVLWLLFFAPGIVKRRIRRFRGRCLHCGYDLRGHAPGALPEAGPSIKCPECGRSAR